MNQETYNRERSKQQELNDNKRAVKRQKMDTTTARELEIEGIRFRVQNDGGKLMRVTGDDVPADVAGRETPKTITISGIVFLRTKHGNLVRDNQKARYICDSYLLSGRDSLSTLSRRTTQRSAKPQCEHFTKHGTVSNPPTMAGCSTSRRRLDCQLAGKNPNLLLTLTTGTCPFGPRCKFSHDPNKVAICKHFLKAGSCPNGDLCDMSHEMTYHRVPACTYFIRGNCTNSACRYPHVHVSPAASVCRPFATLGFCAKGPDCDKRHVVECPDYANRGFCANRENGKCLLPHPDRASTMRKAAERQAKLASGGESDVSSDEEQFIIDVDSDVAEDLTGSDEDRHELTQQQDFVAFS